jgi:hypothetical protein
MKRSMFFLIAGVIACLFGTGMMTMPSAMAMNWGIPGSDALYLFIRMLGMNLLIFGIMLFMSRNDAPSNALKAIILGNILLHGIGLALDVYGTTSGLLNQSALVSAVIVHVVLGGGFAYYYANLKKEASAQEAYAR